MRELSAAYWIRGDDDSVDYSLRESYFIPDDGESLEFYKDGILVDDYGIEIYRGTVVKVQRGVDG